MKNKIIAIVGAGPAGSLAGARLAGSLRRVVLVDEKLTWEKPCGGAIPQKALVAYPFLRDAGIERNWVEQCELISSSGRRASLHLDRPVAIFSRRVLNGLLLEQARDAGAEVVKARVTGIQGHAGAWKLDSTSGEICAEYLILAAGARNPFRTQFCRPFSAKDLMATAGYYIPGSSGLMRIQFLAGLHGYVWVFPRADHYSVGICGKMNGKSTAELRQLLERCLSAAGLNFHGAKFYAHVLPALSLTTLVQTPVRGEGWAMIGDAAGFTDPITGEGLYYALRSAELVAEALVSDRPEAYPALLKKDFLPELETAARVADRFFTGKWMGESVTERMVEFCAYSPRFQQLTCDLFAGTQGYLNLRRRFYSTLPAMIAESTRRALGLMRSKRSLTATARLPATKS